MTQTPIVLHITGMLDGDRVREVAEALLGVEGVQDAEVDAEQHCARVELVEGIDVTREELIRAVEQAGAHVQTVDMPAGR